MIEAWELILHHTYAGTPGVVFDHSPRHGSHGVMVGDPTTFSLDGQTNGSGAVRTHLHGSIQVTPTYGWDRLGALRAEIVFRHDQVGGGNLLNARPLSFVVKSDERFISFDFKTTDHAPGSFLGWQSFEVKFADIGVDPTKWTTAAVAHDGFGTVNVAVNGSIVKSWTDVPLQPVRPVTTVTIGNEPGGSVQYPGLIDDVKVWRPNPTKVTSDFTGRIIADGVTDCWADWGKRFRHALYQIAAQDGECPAILTQLIDDAFTATVTPALTHSPSTRQALLQAVSDYQRLWSDGRVGDIGPVLAGLQQALTVEGIDVEHSAAFQALITNRCFQNLMGDTPRLDCDPAFARMLSGAGG